MRADRAQDGVNEREPQHVAVDVELPAADRNGQNARQIPQDDGKRRERRQLLQEPHRKRERQLHKLPDVLRYALVGIVRALGERFELVVRAILHPACEIAIREPCAPFDLQHLPQIDGVDGDGDMHEGESGKLADERPEKLVLVSLQGVVKLVVPIVDQDEHADRNEIQRDDDGEKPSRLPLLLGKPIAANDRAADAPDALLLHKISPISSALRPSIERHAAPAHRRPAA